MPAYQASGSITALYPGDTATLILAERPAAGVASLQVALGGNPDGSPLKLSVEGLFAGAPGAFEVDLQTSDTDVDADYISQAAVLNAVNANNACRAEFPAIVAKFARLLTKIQTTNAVNGTFRITR